MEISPFLLLWDFKSKKIYVRSKVVSIDGRFDRQKSIRSKTSISSIKVWISSPPTLNLSSTKVSGQVDVFSLPNVRSEHTPLEKLIFFSRSMDKWKVNIFLARWKKFLLVSHFFFFWRDQLKTTFPRRARILHRAIITQHKNFYYYLYACKAVVFIIIYSSIELTLGFDRNDLRSKWLATQTIIFMDHRFTDFQETGMFDCIVTFERLFSPHIGT